MSTTARYGTTLLLLAISFAMSASQTWAQSGDVEARLDALQQTVAQQQRQLDAQASELVKLRKQQAEAWTAESRQAEVDQITEQVLAAAAEQAQPSAGWDNGFYIAAPDNSFRMQLLGQVQFRHVLAIQDNTADASSDDITNGFEVSRFRLGVKGHVVDPSWQYFFWGGHGADGSWLPLDVWIRKQVDDNWWIQAGQFKTPLWKEWLISETRQQFVERSLLNYEFWGVYTEGVNVGYDDGPLHALVSINDGLSASGAPAGVVGGGITSPWNEADVVGVAVTSRVEYLLAGDWGRTADFEAWSDRELMAVVGGAMHYQHGDWHSSGGDEGQVLRWTADVMTEWRGVNLFAAVIGNHVTDLDLGPDVNQYGALVQAGWFMVEDLELMARYEWGDSDTAGENDLSIITLGVSRFFAGHRLKWTTDVGFALNPVAPTWAASGAGWRADSSGQSGQVLVRSQLQLLF